jgi:hypothetical protein
VIDRDHRDGYCEGGECHSARRQREASRRNRVQHPSEAAAQARAGSVRLREAGGEASVERLREPV